MKFTFFTNCISPHQVPLAKVLIQRLGRENYHYVYTEALTTERLAMGWGEVLKNPFAIFIQGDETSAELVDADLLFSGNRAMDVFEKRNGLGKETLYCSERWFKPPLGFIRVLAPSYLKMAWRFVRCLKSAHFKYLPMGIHAARDMARLASFLSGDVRCLFRAPKVAFESRPGGAIVPLKEAIKAGVLSKEAIAFGKQNGFVQIPRAQWGKVEPQKVYAKMRMWGYFVAPGCKTTGVPAAQFGVRSSEFLVNENVRSAAPNSTKHEPRAISNRRLRMLWVGRMLDWKRVDTLIKACMTSELKDKVELHLYGRGPEEEKLRALAKDSLQVHFHDYVPVGQVRDLMRAHDVYILPSDGGEGWGAVVSEALEEGMQVLGTVEAGSSGTILPPTHLFRSGDVKRLTELLISELPKVPIGEWTAEDGAQVLLNHNE